MTDIWKGMLEAFRLVIGLDPDLLDHARWQEAGLRAQGAQADRLLAGSAPGQGRDAGTVDPVYTIGGERYATYMAAMIGVKEETTGVVNLVSGMSFGRFLVVSGMVRMLLIGL